MLKAILFDCNGVIADDEPIHLALFQEVLEREGVRLTREDYFEKYLAMDDKDCFRAVMADHGKSPDEAVIRRLVRVKSELYMQRAPSRLTILPGVVEFVMAAAQKYPLAVASGALRREIELILRVAGIETYFDAVVAAEDVTHGKPDPEAYQKALVALNAKVPSLGARPSECMVVEDSKHGIASAHPG